MDVSHECKNTSKYLKGNIYRVSLAHYISPFKYPKKKNIPEYEGKV